jgi:hypothetical protein
MSVSISLQWGAEALSDASLIMQNEKKEYQTAVSVVGL